MNNTQTFQPIFLENGLSHYVQKIRNYPMLEEKEEKELAIQWQQKKDPKALEKLINSHLRLVIKIAMGYRGYGLPIDELISEGNVGIMNAIKRYDPEKGYRLSTYAIWWVKASIQEYILHSWSLVKIGTTAAQKKLFFNLKKIKRKLKIMDGGDLLQEHVEQISEKLNVPEYEVVNMNRRLIGNDHSLNANINNEQNNVWLDWLVDEQENQEDILEKKEEATKHHETLIKALKTLKKREQAIFIRRRLKEQPDTLKTLGKQYDISRERVRQIEIRAFKKIKHVFEIVEQENKEN